MLGLAESYVVLPGYRILSGKEAYPQAKEAALKALEIDEGLAEAHAALAHVRLGYDFDREAAENEIRRAIELNPNYATAHDWHAFVLVSLGRLEEAISEGKRAQELDPLSQAINDDLGILPVRGGRQRPSDHTTAENACDVPKYAYAAYAPRESLRAEENVHGGYQGVSKRSYALRESSLVSGMARIRLRHIGT